MNNPIGIQITIPMRAIPKARPRMTKAGGVYTPNRTKEFEYQIGALCKRFFPTPYEGKLEVIIVCTFKPSKTELDNDKTIYGKHCTKHGDWDNLAKSICDGLNGIAYNDDRQIVKANLEKLYSQTEYISIEIKNIKE